ncbi:MAG: T9SS C-terminal target domain-containing protein [Winogradskyella sp.]|uniref:T9SS type A sorting domain-containing protein n=1 Tax=Winogradskyella sp. TaxID=1883156 RepID=UPI000F3C66E3|nr:T9SS type A sorting domain-containing protein [Winogradskyella sp.]RNC86860.1 MAG: T9SS C-terminal target domain-containing protein [Winogradskyella sp.]
MKKNYLLLLCLLLTFFANSQGTETFDNEAAGSSSFSENGTTFNITSSTGEDYDVFEDGFSPNNSGIPISSDQCAGCGWNSLLMSADQKFVDLTGTGNDNGDGNGSSFTVSTSTGDDVTIKSLYLFCSTGGFVAHSGTLTITGRSNGSTVYSFTFSGTYANPVTFSPNNGFTFIDLATADVTDWSNTNVDEITFTSTGNLDYMALDSFTWGQEVFSTNDFEIQNRPRLYPNPSTAEITIKNLNGPTNYTIVDILGKTVKNGEISPNEYVDISKLKTGVYLINLNGYSTLRLVKN